MRVRFISGMPFKRFALFIKLCIFILLLDSCFDNVIVIYNCFSVFKLPTIVIAIIVVVSVIVIIIIIIFKLHTHCYYYHCCC